jgi:hypothetical protein
MTPQLVFAAHVSDYRIRLRFSDGTDGIVDLEPELWGEVYPELRTLVWPNGADLAPESLHEMATSSR